MNKAVATVLLTDHKIDDEKDCLYQVRTGDMSNEEGAGDEGREEESSSLLLEKQTTVVPLAKCSKSCKRKRLKVSILLLVILLVFIGSCLVALSVTIPLYIRECADEGDTLSLDDILNTSFHVKSYQAEWTANGDMLYFSLSDGVQLFSPTDNTSRTIIEPSILEQFNVDEVKLSPSGEYALLVCDREQVYRHSSLAQYYIMNLNNASDTWHLETYDCSNSLSDCQLQYAEWRPVQDDHKVVLVREGNMHLYDMTTNWTERITDGVYVGVPDWVYEEEVFGSDHTLWWSPDGQHILYLSIDDDGVSNIQYPVYTGQEGVYPAIKSIPYPKAGTVNPKIKASTYEVASNSTRDLDTPMEHCCRQSYIIHAAWADNSAIVVGYMSRNQTVMDYYEYTPMGPVIDMVYKQISNAWIEVVSPLVFLEEGDKMVVIDSVAVDSDSFLHLVQIDRSTHEKTILTGPGEWEVTGIIGSNGVDEILYTSTQTLPTQRHIYSLSTDACLTCDQRTWIDNGGDSQSNECHYWSGTCSDNLSHCLLTCQGPTVPYTVLVEYINGQFTPVNYLETNSVLKEVIATYDLPHVEEILIPADNEGPILYTKALFPPGSTHSCDSAHPLLFYVYGGPYSQTAQQNSVLYSLFPMYLSSALDAIVVRVDGRGTGFRGDNFKFSVYRDLGLLETIDQIRAAKYFHRQCYSSGADQTAIYGSSYGGYMAGMVGSDQSGVFSTAISQSPVTSWLYYDSIYTERYMGQPDATDNIAGYEDSSLLNRAAHLSDINYLLIHGTADDNVHFQNTALLVDKLTRDNVQFRMQIYTDQTHALSETRRHLYTLIEDFLRESF